MMAFLNTAQAQEVYYDGELDRACFAFMNGVGVEQDLDKAWPICAKAAKSGAAGSQNLIGMIYIANEGQKELGIYWLRKAAGRGHTGAIEQLKKMGIIVSNCEGKEGEAAPSDWKMTDGCYIKNKIASTPKGNIYFWRLTDNIRASQGGGNENDLPSAAIVLTSSNTDTLIKSYCPNYCWMMGNGDILPQIEALSGSNYAVWAPDDRLAHRHGTNGYIEILDINTQNIHKISEKLDIRWDTNPAFIGRGKLDQCEFLVFSAIKSYEPPNSEDIAGGYRMVKYPHLQSITEGCKSIGYDGTEKPDEIIQNLNQIINNRLTWIEKF